MSNLKDTSKIVREILKENKRARSSDSFLYLQVLRRFSQDTGTKVHEMSVQSFLFYMNELGVPPFETVRRARQLAQAKYPELSAIATVQQFRRENEAEYYAFALEER